MLLLLLLLLLLTFHSVQQLMRDVPDGWLLL
jgi:hypothetical protein